MKVEREKPCQRRYHRVTAPMKVTFPNGFETNATDWSVGGIRVDGIKKKDLPDVGDVLELLLELPFQGFEISFDVKARVVRTVPEEGTIGCEYEELSERAGDLMRHFIDDLIRGKMATIEDTICRIDIPVTPISTKPDPNPLQEVPIRRWSPKAMFMSTFYGTLAVSIFGYLLLLIYTHTMRMEVTSAVVSAPLANIHVPMDGVLMPVSLQEDEIVRQGQTIARIMGSDIESKIADKRIELTEAKNKLARTEEKYRIEKNRIKLYQIVTRTDREIAKAKVISYRQALKAADAQVERMTILKEKGLVTIRQLDEAEKQQALIMGSLREAELELERDSAMDSVSERRYYNHKEFVTDLDIIALQVEEVSQRVLSLTTQLEELELRKQNTIIKAPFDGRIVSVKQAEKVTVFRNQPLLTIEKLEVPTVTAFLDQDQVLNVGLSDVAKVFVPALDRHIDARVYKIDRNSAFLDTKASHYMWTDSKEKSAAVSLQLDIPISEVTHIRGGLPVVVIFPKRSTNSMLSQMKIWMGDLRKVASDEASI